MIPSYYNKKYIDFIADPLSEIEIERLVKNYNDGKKIQYYTNRAIDKLKSIHVSTKFILEISQFEKRFLPEEYHGNSNILLLWFMQKIIFSDPHVWIRSSGIGSMMNQKSVYSTTLRNSRISS